MLLVGQPPLPRWAQWAWSRLKGGLDTSLYTTAMSVLHDCRPVATLCPAWPTPPPPGKRYMSAGIGNGTADLLLGPGLGMAQCVTYDSDMKMAQMSHNSATKHFGTDTNGVPSQLRSGHNCATPQLRNVTKQAHDRAIGRSPALLVGSMRRLKPIQGGNDGRQR